MARPQLPDLLGAIRAFDGFGAPTLETTEDGIPYLVNEFWTAGQRQAPALHEVSYRACFKPQLPEFFIARLTAPGEAVHDPFMGRGTTPLQAALMGRRPTGNDINPLSVLLTRPRLAPPGLDAIAAALARVPWEAGRIERDDLLAFYHPETLRRLSALKAWLAEQAPLADSRPDPVLDWIRMVALNRLSGHSPGFFSGRTMPPNQAVSVAAQRRINARLGVMPPPRDVAALILRKSRSLLSEGVPPPHPAPLLLTGPADSTPAIAAGSIALVVTSPPFLDVVQYAEDNWLRCWFSGIDPSGVAIAMHRGEAAWAAMVRDVLAEQARLLRPGGHIAFEVGEVRGGKVLLERLVWQAAEGLPLERLAVLVNSQHFTKTANCWGVANNRRGTNTNRIVLLRKPKATPAR
ncbi:DNA methyltransferase [Falsiroseomonas sp.]|uniref:DNA methyltransferase n=1 Tax=Falsiroseomonas sp. TaxID=2870721 RepID=UPI00356651BB